MHGRRDLDHLVHPNTRYRLQFSPGRTIAQPSIVSLQPMAETEDQRHYPATVPPDQPESQSHSGNIPERSHR
jgi:hypothetical protein